jgi:5-methylcytosine-specific restriction endonuclease McrA
VERTLLLNATYEPLRIVSWQRAVILLIKGKVEVIAAYDRVIRGVSVSLEHPSVLRLRSRVRVAKRFHHVPFSRANIYLRDKHICQYCGQKLPSSELTLDHVVPASLGGRKVWENIVTCCVACNRRKGNRAPADVGLQLVRTPKRPTFLPALRISLGIGEVPESWRDYLYWHAEQTG